MIRLSEVEVARGSTRIVTALTLEISPGRIYWIVGSNGAGKSTLLRTIVGLDAPRHGTVDRDFPDRATLLYFQNEMTPPPSSTVRDWERLIDGMGGGGGSGRTALWPRVPGGRRVGRLSTGERKRLLLDAVVRQPGPVVLDEPFEHLSPDAKSDLRTLLDRRARHHIVIVATNQDVGRGSRDGGLLLRGGTATPLADDGATPPPWVQP